ncbi:MAG: ATP-binding protein [Pseudomonadota bacterium]
MIGRATFSLAVTLAAMGVHPSEETLVDAIEAADALINRDAYAAFEAARAILARAQETGSIPEQIDAMLVLSAAAESVGNADRALALAKEALSAAEVEGDVGRMVDAYNRAAVVHMELKDIESAAVQMQAAVSLVDSIDDLERRAKTYHQFARVRRFQFRREEALPLYAYALEASLAAGDRLGAVDVIGNRGVLLESMGQYEAALESQTEALEFYREIGDEAGIATAMYNISRVYRGLGDYDQYLAFAQDSLAIDEKVGDQSDLAYSYTNVGEAYFRHGDIAMGRRFLQRAIASFENIGVDLEAARARAVLADIEIAADDLERARALLERAAITAEEKQAYSLSATVMQLFLRLELASGNVAEAIRYGSDGIDLARRIGERYQEDKLIGGLILALEAGGEYASATQALKEQRELRAQLADDARSQAMAWTQTQAEFMRRAERIELLEAERALQELRIEEARRVRLFLTLGAIALLVIGALFYRRLDERRQNQRLQESVQERTRALRIALRARNDFLANVSHEIRTPMNAVIGFTRLALNAVSAQDLRRFLEQSDRAAHGLLHLLNDVLDLSKLEAGMMQRSDVVVHLGPLFEEVVDMSGAWAIETKVMLATELDPALPSAVRIDGSHLKQILVNLVSNALKFTVEGRVTLRCLAESRTRTRMRLRFEVEDTGPGIAPDDQARMFAPFEQIDSSTTRRHGGTGLGLAISRQLVGLLGGELTVRSELGSGSCFSFLVEADEVSQEELETATGVSDVSVTEGEPFAGLRLLVVDDSSINCEVVVALVEMLGGNIRSVTSGAACLEALASEVYDLILMDLHMPLMDGAAVTRRIRSQRRLAQLPIIAMTASVLEEEIAAARAAGMDDMLPKPFEEAELVHTVLKHVGRSPERDCIPQAERRSA